MLRAAAGSWGESVTGLCTFSSISVGLYSAADSYRYSYVDKQHRFYESLRGLMPGLFHAAEAVFISVRLELIPAIHTAYNKRLLYLNLVINSRRLA